MAKVKPAVVVGKPAVDVDPENFSLLVVTMSRLLTGFARIPVFADANLSLAEWVALAILGQRDGVTNKFLGRALGVSGQRANQICATLVKSGFVTVGQSAKDNRANDIKVTAAGKAKLDAIDSQLKPMLAVALAGKEHVLGSASKHLKIVSRILDVGKEGGAEDKKANNRRARETVKER